MATISTRIDDDNKAAAEKIANEIGIPLSTAINIFIKRFVKEKGFPFQITAVNTSNESQKPIFDENLLDSTVKQAISDQNNSGLVRQFTYLDPKTKKYITVIREE